MVYSNCIPSLLQPENLLVDILRVSSKDNGQDINDIEAQQSAIRLIDFGGARILTSDRNSHQESTAPQDSTPSNLRVPPESLPAVLGSPEFLAPEILARETVGAQADHWSLGVLVYVLVR